MDIWAEIGADESVGQFFLGNGCGRASERNPKRRGELVELAFMRKAVSLGFGVAKPYGDSECYDFVLDSQLDSRNPGRGLWRVQVKSTDRYKKGGYLIGACHFAARGTKQAYTAEQIDFLVGYIVPEDAWYVIPVREFAPRKYLSFYPQNWGSVGRWERFREAWGLMRE
jgi:hypothetical protein